MQGTHRDLLTKNTDPYSGIRKTRLFVFSGVAVFAVALHLLPIAALRAYCESCGFHFSTAAEDLKQCNPADDRNEQQNDINQDYQRIPVLCL